MDGGTCRLSWLERAARQPWDGGEYKEGGRDRREAHLVEKGKQVVASRDAYVGATDHLDDIIGKTGRHGEIVDETAADVCTGLGWLW